MQDDAFYKLIHHLKLEYTQVDSSANLIHT
jgi:hypothetical protein